MSDPYRAEVDFNSYRAKTDDDNPSPKTGCLKILGCGCLTLILLTVLAVVFVERFCISGVRLRVSPETTLLTEPLKKDGKSIDYFTVVETAREQNRPVEQNGFRTVLQFYGKNAVLYGFLSQSSGFDWHYDELCKELNVDPMIPPRGKLVLPDSFLPVEEEESVQIKADDEHFPQAEELEAALSSEKQRLAVASRPWTLEEFPKMKNWLAAMNEGLDTVCTAVLGDGQKEHYYRVPFIRRNENEYCFFAYPVGIPLFHRNLIEALQIRAMYRLGTKKPEDVNLAWRDILTQLHLTRREETAFNSSVTGAVMGFRHFTSMLFKDLLDNLSNLENVTTAQLEQWIQDVEMLPQFTDREKQLKEFQYFVLDAVGAAHSLKEAVEKWGNDFSSQSFGVLGTIGFDSNILAKHINAGFAEFQTRLEAAKDYETLTELLSPDANDADLKRELQKQQEALKANVLGWATVSGRSVNAGILAGKLFPKMFEGVLGRQLLAETNGEVLRLVLLLQKYKQEKGTYPETLESLNRKPSNIPSQYQKTDKGYSLKTGSGKMSVEYER